MAIVISSKVKLADAVRDSLWVREPGVLYWATLQQFKARPNKKRCIAIYETFISADGPWEGALAESGDAVKQVAARRQMQAMVDWMKEMREQAAGMNIFSRIRSSSTRDVTHSTFFDAYNELIKLEVSNGCLTEFLVTPNPTPRKAIGAWRMPVGVAISTLESAGFDVKALGLKAL